MFFFGLLTWIVLKTVIQKHNYILRDLCLYFPKNFYINNKIVLLSLSLMYLLGHIFCCQQRDRVSVPKSVDQTGLCFPIEAPLFLPIWSSAILKHVPEPLLSIPGKSLLPHGVQRKEADTIICDYKSQRQSMPSSNK